ncbi:sigma-70 family RNA polymerase sigma factor [Paenibacillus sp. BJ-4]|uniref:sigma-70 family RNA polymerase sigma factor n=1 Tax=Paenibacillus sp. BJ-4 TaxID=2878097 RepID=UPI001CF08851|nr:sigma-70 family RNA polymerase sigma factor [Paenibacillus sp. BJ-4]
MEEDLFFQKISAQKRRLFGIAFSYLRNQTDAVDAVQETTCRAWMKRKQVKDANSFDSWVTRILINVCVDEQRRRKRLVLADGRIDIETNEMINDSMLDVQNALAKLKPKHRHVLILKYMHDMTVPDIARILEKPEGTIKSWVYQGLKQLRRKMGIEEGGLNHA